MNRLRELRKHKQLSQSEFAAAFNQFLKDSDLIKGNHGNVKTTSQVTISRWENEQSPIPRIYFSSLADFLEVSVPYLLGVTVNTDNLSKNKLVYYRIDTNESRHYCTDTLSFKQMGGQQFLECSGRHDRRAFINTAQIIAIEEREEEDVKND